jgi:hypothetical protein
MVIKQDTTSDTETNITTGTLSCEPPIQHATNMVM